MDPLQTWAALAAVLLVTFTVIAELHGWLNTHTDDDKD